MFLPRPFRIAFFFRLITPLQIAIILTANYAFLNYHCARSRIPSARRSASSIAFGALAAPRRPNPFWQIRLCCRPTQTDARSGARRLDGLRLSLGGILLSWDFYVTATLLITMICRFAASTCPRALARSIPSCQSVRLIRGHDARSLRDRISRLSRRQNLDYLCISPQAPGSLARARHLRALPASL